MSLSCSMQPLLCWFSTRQGFLGCCALLGRCRGCCTADHRYCPVTFQKQGPSRGGAFGSVSIEALLLSVYDISPWWCGGTSAEDGDSTTMLLTPPNRQLLTQSHILWPYYSGPNPEPQALVLNRTPEPPEPKWLRLKKQKRSVDAGSSPTARDRHVVVRGPRLLALTHTPT